MEGGVDEGMRGRERRRLPLVITAARAVALWFTRGARVSVVVLRDATRAPLRAGAGGAAGVSALLATLPLAASLDVDAARCAAPDSVLHAACLAAAEVGLSMPALRQRAKRRPFCVVFCELARVDAAGVCCLRGLRLGDRRTAGPTAGAGCTLCALCVRSAALAMSVAALSSVATEGAASDGASLSTSVCEACDPGSCTVSTWVALCAE